MRVCQVGGKQLPAGTRVHINIWGVHHDAAHWPEPEAFRPERFLPGAQPVDDRHPNAFLGFGIGACAAAHSPALALRES